jgi:hypothetical protein
MKVTSVINSLYKIWSFQCKQWISFNCWCPSYSFIAYTVSTNFFLNYVECCKQLKILYLLAGPITVSLNQLNPVHTLTHYYSDIHLNTIHHLQLSMLCINPRCQVAWESKFCMVAPNICGSSARYLLLEIPCTPGLSPYGINKC